MDTMEAMQAHQPGSDLNLDDFDDDDDDDDDEDDYESR